MSEITCTSHSSFRKDDVFTMGLQRSWRVRFLAWWHGNPIPKQLWVVTDTTNAGPGGIIGVEKIP